MPGSDSAIIVISSANAGQLTLYSPTCAPLPAAWSSFSKSLLKTWYNLELGECYKLQKCGLNNQNIGQIFCF